MAFMKPVPGSRAYSAPPGGWRRRDSGDRASLGDWLQGWYRGIGSGLRVDALGGLLAGLQGRGQHLDGQASIGGNDHGGRQQAAPDGRLAGTPEAIADG